MMIVLEVRLMIFQRDKRLFPCHRFYSITNIHVGGVEHTQYSHINIGLYTFSQITSIQNTILQNTASQDISLQNLWLNKTILFQVQ